MPVVVLIIVELTRCSS